MYFVFCRLYPCSSQPPTAVFGSERLERGGPMLTLETEVNGDSKKTNERGPFLVGSLGLSCRYKRFLICLGCSSPPSKKIFFFLTVHYFKSFKSFVPIAQQVGQAAVLSHLSLSACVSLVWLPPVISLLLTNTVSPMRACLSKWLQRFRRSQK